MDAATKVTMKLNPMAVVGRLLDQGHSVLVMESEDDTYVTTSFNMNVRQNYIDVSSMSGPGTINGRVDVSIEINDPSIRTLTPGWFVRVYEASGQVIYQGNFSLHYHEGQVALYNGGHVDRVEI